MPPNPAGSRVITASSEPISVFVTGTATDFAWNTVNAGKTYDSVDWSKFKTDDDDEDEDNDEDEEDEEEEGDEEEDEDDE